MATKKVPKAFTKQMEKQFPNGATVTPKPPGKKPPAAPFKKGGKVKGKC